MGGHGHPRRTRCWGRVQRGDAAPLLHPASPGSALPQRRLRSRCCQRCPAPPPPPPAARPETPPGAWQSPGCARARPRAAVRPRGQPPRSQAPQRGRWTAPAARWSVAAPAAPARGPDPAVQPCQPPRRARRARARRWGRARARSLCHRSPAACGYAGHQQEGAHPLLPQQRLRPLESRKPRQVSAQRCGAEKCAVLGSLLGPWPRPLTEWGQLRDAAALRRLLQHPQRLPRLRTRPPETARLRCGCGGTGTASACSRRTAGRRGRSGRCASAAGRARAGKR